jgi:hypothetical protein
VAQKAKHFFSLERRTKEYTFLDDEHEHLHLKGF